MLQRWIPVFTGMTVISSLHYTTLHRKNHFIISKNSFSLNTRTPNFFALSNLLPASTPATTAVVFLLTLSATFPPSDLILSFAIFSLLFSLPLPHFLTTSPHIQYFPYHTKIPQ